MSEYLSDIFNLSDELVTNQDSLVDLIIMVAKFAIIFGIVGLIVGIFTVILSKLKGSW